MAELIEMLFVMWTLGPKKPLLGGDSDPPYEGEFFKGNSQASKIATVDVLNLTSKGAAGMQPVSNSTVTQPVK